MALDGEDLRTLPLSLRKTGLARLLRGKWLPEVGLGRVRLRPGPGDNLEVEQAGGRTDRRGQFVLAVEDCRHNPEELFASAQAAEQAADNVEAERLYRLLMKGDPKDPSAAFNLGNMLRSHGRNVEAEAALRTTTRIDPDFAEAWYNLGDLLDDQGRSEAAIECLRKSLKAAPDYADAMFNLASDVAPEKRIRRSCDLLPPLSYDRRQVGMGRSRPPIDEIL